MTTPDVILSLTETTLERVMDLYSGGMLHSLDTPLQVAYAEAPYGDTASFLQGFIDYHTDMLESYTALKEHYQLLSSIAEATETLETPLEVATRIEEKIDALIQLPETD